MFIFLTILFFELIIVIHELGHFLAARFFKVSVKEFSIGFGPAIFKFSKNGVRYCLRLFFLGGFVAFEDEEKLKKISILKRFFVVLAGPMQNILAGLLSISLVLLIQGKYNTTKVESVAFYCDRIKVGDEIKQVNKKNILSANDLKYRLFLIPLKEPINLTVKRDGKMVEILNVGKIFEEKNTKKRAIGVTLKVEKLHFFNFFKEVFLNFIFSFKLIFSSIFYVFKEGGFFKNFSGPVGFSRNVYIAEKNGLCSLIFLFSFLSINVGVFNLLPFPILDGGQILFLGYERFFKRSVKKRLKEILNVICFYIIVLLFIAITFKDIVSLVR